MESERLNVLPHHRHELENKLQLREEIRERDPLQRWKDFTERRHQLWHNAAQPPAQPLKPFQKAVFQVTAFFSFSARPTVKPGSGALITSQGHLLTNSHVVRLGPGYCVKPPVEGDVAPLIVLLVTEDLQKPPIPRYVANFVTDDPQLDIAVLKISQELKEGLNNLRDLEEKVAAAGSREAFLAQWAREGPVSSIPIQPLTLWDSDAVLVGQRVIALGYPRPDDKQRNPPLNTDDRGNIQAPPEGFLRVGAAFAAPGSSGGAVVRAEEGREYLIGLICAGEFGTGAGTALARPINAAVDGPIKAANLAINQAPAAHFIPKPSLPRPRETVVFDALERSRNRDGRIQECQWHIKEDSQSLTLPGCRIERSFPPDSQPTVTLTVRDDKGLIDAFTQAISLKREEGPCRAKLLGADGQLKAEFDSIQAAINQAGPGDLIEVVPPKLPLVCAESLEIKGKRDLTLRGARSIDDAPAFVLAGDGKNPTVLVANSESITLQGLTITQGNPGVRVESSRAIRVKQSILRVNRAHGILWVSSSGRVSDDSRLEGNLADLQGLFGQGLTAEQKSVVDIIDTEIAGNAAAGVGVTEESELKLEFVQIHENDDGLVIDGAKQVTVQNVRVRENNKAGISARNATLTIASSRIEGSREDGLSLTDATVEIKENTVISRNFGGGLALRGSAQVTLINSSVSGNRSDGLSLLDSAQAILTNSTVSRNGYGLVLEDSAQVTLTDSTVLGNWGHGLLLRGNAQATLKNNIIEGNEGCGISSFSSQPVRGSNNWMRKNGNDLCGNLTSQLRLPLREATESEIRWPDGRFASLQEAVDALLPFGVLAFAPGTVQEEGITLYKPLVLQGDRAPAPELRGRTLLPIVPALSLIEEAEVIIQGLRITGGEEGLLLSSNARVTLQDSSVSGYRLGLALLDSAQAIFINSQVSMNEYGLFLGGSAQAILQNSTVSWNRFGLSLSGGARATLTNSAVSGNGFKGLRMRDSAWITIEGSTIEKNGTDMNCAKADTIWICNGIEVQNESQTTIIDSKIINNADWGLAAVLKQCGYDENGFTGQVVFQGNNVIEGNNTSGNQNGKGNPGNHPWNRPDVPDGQVCLP